MRFTNPYTYVGTVLNVVDGDTIDILVDLGFKTYTKLRFRLADINTPETYGVKMGSEEYAKGMKAKLFVEQYCPKGTVVRITTEKDKTGKYGRYIAYITPMDKTVSVNEALLKEGLAVKASY